MLVPIVGFILIFGIFVGVSTVGFKYIEAKRRKNVAGVLEIVRDEHDEPAAGAKILRDVEGDKRGSPMAELAKKLNFAQKATAEILQAGLDWTPQKLLTMMVVGACGGLAIGLALPGGMAPISGIGLGTAGGAIPYMMVRRKRKKRLAKFEEQFPEALDFLARSMRAGHAFSISLAMCGDEMADPMGQEIRTLSHEVNLGGSMESSLKNLCDRVPLVDIRFFASSVLLQKQTGGNLSEILNRLSYVIRERFRLKGQVRAVSSHGRLTAGILTALPVVTMLALLAVAPEYLQTMFQDPDGKKIIAGAVVAQIVGKLVINKIIDIKV